MKKLFISLGLCALVGVANASSPLWLRNTALSPDGKTIAFTYKGHIYTVPATGGDARQITSGSSYNTTPKWSPDGSKIAFGSDREGSMDIFIVERNGGRPVRLTTHSGNETLLGFKDNDHLLYSSSVLPDRIAANGAFFPQTYVVATDASRPELYLSLPMRAADTDAAGRIIYQDRKGYENEWRKHEISSSTGDIWMYDKGSFKRITDFPGNDQNPVWGAGDTFYYISEEDGTLNVYSRSVNGSGKTQLTKFTNHPVRSLSADRSGNLAFSWDGEIYTLAPGSEPKKVNVNIVTDDYDRMPSGATRRSGASNIAVSPDGETVAFVLEGDVYLTSTEFETTRRVTNTPEQERCVDFAPDGRSIVYDSERDGIWQLFTTTIKDPSEKSMLYATELVEEPLYKSTAPSFQPDYSPDGKKVAFLEDRTILQVLDLDTKKVTTALDGKYNYSYSDGDVSFEWSPDSRWLLADYIGVGGWNNTDIALVKADGSEVIDLSESGYSDGQGQWAMDGKAVTWTTGKYGYKSHGSWGNESDVVIMFLDGEAYDRFNMTEEEVKLADKAEKDKKEADDKKADDKKAKKDKKNKKGKNDKADKADDVKPLVFDLDNRRYRKARLTGSPSRMGAYYLSKKGDKLYYVASSPDGRSLYERDLKEGDTKTLVKGLSAWSIVADKKGENIFVETGSGIKKITLSNGKQEDVKYSADITNSPAERRRYIYEHAWRQVRDKFYDVNLHGVDWDMYKEAYTKFLPYINNNYDFAILLSEILGELNASHTGGRYYMTKFCRPTATLGAFVDSSYKGDGLAIAEVVKRGPLDSKSVGVQPGDVILAINDSVIKAGKDYYPLLDGKRGKKVKLNVRKKSGKEEVVYARPISDSELSGLLYERWVENNENVVDSVSGGRIGYIHIEGMDASSFSNAYERLLGKYRNCDAVIVDTRHNGGGWLHNDVALLLNGKENVRYSPRGKYIGSDPFSQWTKPSVMLVDESNYSDAHGTPYVYQTLKIGDVVGAPIPGTMTAVWWETQIDSSLVFGIPQVTSLDRNGQPLENKQLNPEVVIYNEPDQVLKGVDQQLIGATKHLMKKLNK